ncbi:MAG: PEP-CTERM sorting domain-containing protein [Pyrinomonadaceae bacterium]|nr:PEP-CTERM sorting domain-containing protein [Pyrinomonadaceae bacterium]
MKSQLTSLLKSLSIAIAIVGVMMLAQGQARADEVTISGFTTGASTVGQLTFTGNSSFTNTTFLGIGALSGANNLGIFSLSTAPGELLGGIFNLNITFTSPGGINGGQGTNYTATILGSVSPNINQGGVNINFDNTPTVFTFFDGVNNGSFSLTLADLYVESGQSAMLTAGTTGQQTAIPEPATLLLIGTGLTGLAAKLRKRRRETLASS